MLFELVVGFVTLLLILVLRIFQIKRRFSSIAHFPGPKGSLLLGNALDLGLNPTSVLGNALNIVKNYGNCVRMWIGPTRPFLWVSDLKFLEFILTSTVHIDKSQDYVFLHYWLGNGLLVSGGNYWRKRRKLIVPSFHLKMFVKYIDDFNNNGDILLKKLSTYVGKDPIDIFPLITLCTLDVVCDTIMGTSINAQVNSDSDYVKAVNKACWLLIDRSFSPWKQYDVLFRLSNSYREQKNAMNTLHSYSTTVIQERRKKIAEENENEKSTDGENKNGDNFEDIGLKKRVSFLDLLIKSSNSGEYMSDEEIREQVDTFMFAGHDTTATTIIFALYEIARHPEIQDKIVEELRSVLQCDKTAQIKYQDLNEMSYLELVIKETLRLYPSVPYYAREIKQEFVYDGVRFPPGLTLTLFPFALHRNPELYPEPEKFIPERFLPENSRERNPYAYLPFSSGPRNCIGQKFAMLEIKVMLSNILRRFEISSPKDHNVILSSEVVLKSANGVPVQFKDRMF